MDSNVRGKGIIEFLDESQLDKVSSVVADECVNNGDSELIGKILREGDLQAVKMIGPALNVDDSDLYSVVQDGSYDDKNAVIQELKKALEARAGAEVPSLEIITDIANMATAFVFSVKDDCDEDELAALRQTVVEIQAKLEGNDEVGKALAALLEELPEPEEESEETEEE